ncbi:c-type cytochrome [Variovorax sp. RKNM96]|uniref:cytochrome c n=1 Tax=Variovorax sp. RKNM96 TaxID=2681552 RepID=UPI001980461B|nr:cytochrome c [Variovorax sp. RKNM96]QSI30396.1 c-type cytochrome [Variovorax sp. RKNM96]
MKLRLWMATLAVIAAAAVGAGAYAWQPSIDALPDRPVPSDNQALLAQGARIAAQGDCMVCHTSANGKPYAGGLPLKTPFGTIYSTNITPDTATGIGSWSLAAFERAMRSGVSRDGHLLYPAFPYAHFTRMTEEDVGALYAYLMARTPAESKPPANELVFPLGFRPLVAGWNLLFLQRGPLPAPATPQSAEWLRGQYLVEGAGHCASCHTPMNMLGAEKSGQAFAGNLIDGWEAPPLNALASKSPKPWTREQLVAYLRTGLASEHGAASGPMRPVTEHMADVPEADVRAIATYILALDTKATASSASASTPTPAPTIATAGQRVDSGAALFAGACAGCHAATAPMGTIGERPSLALSTAINADSARNAIRTVLGGNPWNGSTPAHFMPPFADVLSDAQIAEVLTYVRASSTQRPAWPDLEKDVAHIRNEASPK